jgi:hypothetical protein
MARLEDIEGAKVALDSVIFIYALEGNQEFGDRVLKIFETIEHKRLNKTRAIAFLFPEGDRPPNNPSATSAITSAANLTFGTHY